MLSVVVLLKLVSYTHAQLFDPHPMPAIIPDLASCAYVRMSDDAPALVLCCGQRHGNLVAPPECLTECVLEYEEPDMTLKRWACPGGANVTTADYAVPLPTNPPPSTTAPFKLIPPSTPPAMIIVSPTLPQTTSGLTSPPIRQSTITPRPGTTTTRIVISTTVSPTSPKFQSPPSTLQSSALTTSSPVTTAGTASQLGNGSNGQNTAAGAAATTDQVTATSESDKVPSTTDGQSGAITTETSSCSPSKNVAGGIREIMVMLLASLAMVVVV